MKKITNNTFLGKLTLILNAVVLVLFILSMVFLMKFDKTNIVVVQERPAYDAAYEEYVTAQHPLKQDSAEVAYYQYKLDTLQQKTVTAKDEKQALADMIANTKETLSEKQKAMDEHIAAVADIEKSYNGIKEHWDGINADNDKTKSSFWVMAIITIVAFLVKTFVIATYGFRNSKNIHEAANWMKNGMKPYMSYVSWFVPVYNLLKPVSFIKEVWEETDYILEDKAIVADANQKVDNSGIHFGIWWFLMLCSVWLMNFVLYKTFFTEGPLFIKANHGTMTIVAIVLMVLCMLEEVYLILTYNKKNKMLVDNAEKF